MMRDILASNARRPSKAENRLAAIAPHRGLIGAGLVALGLLLVVWMTIDGAFFVRVRSRGGYTWAGLLQTKRCDRGDACYGVFNERVFARSRWYEGARYALLLSLATLVLALAAAIANRLSPDQRARFPEPTAKRGAMLFSEVLALGLVLPFLKPSGWSIGAGYITFMCGAALTLTGCLLLNGRSEA